MKGVPTILAVLSMTGCANLIYNSDRPDFRGPIVKPLWTVTKLSISDRPYVHDGVVYVQPFVAGHTELHAYDLKTGKRLWASNIHCKEIKVVIGTLLFATDDQDLLHQFDAKTGKENGSPFAAKMLSATASGNLLVSIYSNRSVVLYDRPGHKRWEAAVPMRILFNALMAGDNSYVYGQLLGEHDEKQGCAIHAFDASTGALRWKWQTDKCSGLEESPLSDLTADHETAFLRIDTVQSNDKSGAIIALDATTGTQKWSSDTVQFHGNAPILFDAATVVAIDNIPGDHGGTAYRKNPYIVRGLDRATGQTKWESRTAWKYDSWTADKGLLFVADRMAHALVGDGSQTSPDSFLTVVDIRTAKELWRSETIQLGSFTTPVVADGIVVVGCQPYGSENLQIGGLYAYPATRGGN